MDSNEKLYRILCKINKRCKDYFFWNKNVGNGYELDRYVDEIIRLSKDLAEIRKQQTKAIEEEKN